MHPVTSQEGEQPSPDADAPHRGGGGQPAKRDYVHWHAGVREDLQPVVDTPRFCHQDGRFDDGNTARPSEFTGLRPCVADDIRELPTVSRQHEHAVVACVCHIQLPLVSSDSPRRLQLWRLSPDGAAAPLAICAHRAHGLGIDHDNPMVANVGHVQLLVVQCQTLGILEHLGRMKAAALPTHAFR
eukprot:3921865-Prymnesium_polylepis.2